MATPQPCSYLKPNMEPCNEVAVQPNIWCALHRSQQAAADAIAAYLAVLISNAADSVAKKIGDQLVAATKKRGGK